jgi:roadblock/LC7 domain-containing protein
MGLIRNLMAQPGVLAAGEYSYRGDRFSYEGDLTPELARMASIMCRATHMGVHMQCDMLGVFCPGCGLVPSRGWAIRGPRYSVCVMANFFCIFENREGTMNAVLRHMHESLDEAPTGMI